MSKLDDVLQRRHSIITIIIINSRCSSGIHSSVKYLISSSNFDSLGNFLILEKKFFVLVSFLLLLLNDTRHVERSQSHSLLENFGGLSLMSVSVTVTVVVPDKPPM